MTDEQAAKIRKHCEWVNKEMSDTATKHDGPLALFRTKDILELLDERDRLKGALRTINDDLPAHAQLTISLTRDERDEARRIARDLYESSTLGLEERAPYWLVKP